MVSLLACPMSTMPGSLQLSLNTSSIACDTGATTLAERVKLWVARRAAKDGRLAVGLNLHLGKFVCRRRPNVVTVRCDASRGKSEISASPPFDWERHGTKVRTLTGVASVLAACVSGFAFKYALDNLAPVKPLPPPPPPVPVAGPQTTGPSFGLADFKDDATFRRMYAPIPGARCYRQVWEVPNPRITRNRAGWVTDQSCVFTASDMIHLNAVVNSLKQSHNMEVAIVTLPDIGPKHTPKSFATDLFNYWGVGDPAENNGVLMLLVTGPRRLEIEIGTGLNEVMEKSGWLKGMTSSVMAPLLHEDKYGEAFDRGLVAIGELLEKTPKQQHGSAEVPSMSSGDPEHASHLLWAMAAIPVGLYSGRVALSMMGDAVGPVTSLVLLKDSQQPASCSACGSRRRMAWDRWAKLEDVEDEGKRQEMRIGSVGYYLLRCADCGHAHLVGTTRWVSGHAPCPSCGYRALLTERHRRGNDSDWKTVFEAQRCTWCDYTRKKQYSDYSPSTQDDSSGFGGGSSSGDGSGTDY